MVNYPKIITVIAFLSIILIIVPTIGFGATQCSDINFNEYIPRSTQLLVGSPPYPIHTTHCLIIKGSQMVGWNQREYENNPNGGILAGINPNKEYIFIEYDYFAFQFYPHYGSEHEPVYVIIDPDSKEALYYGANFHYQNLLYEPNVANPWVTFLPDVNTPIFHPPTTVWHNNWDARSNTNEHEFIDNNPDVPSQSDKEWVKNTVDYFGYA